MLFTCTKLYENFMFSEQTFLHIYIYIYIIYYIYYIYHLYYLYYILCIYANNYNNTSALVIPTTRISFVREIKNNN